MIALIFSLAISTLAHGAATADVTACIQALSVLKMEIQSNKPGGKSVKGGNKSQAARLKIVVDALSPEQRKELFATLSKHDLSNLMAGLDVKRVDKKIAGTLEQQPELAAILLDLAQFGDTFPGIYALKSADTVIPQILSAITDQEGPVEGVSNKDLLSSQSMAPRMKWAINDTIGNLIRQATLEYSGFDFGRTFWQRLWDKTRRFFFPSYAKVMRMSEAGREIQRQLFRLQSVDSIIIDHALGDSKALGLTNDELAKMTFQVLNSPDEISELEAIAKKVFGRTFTMKDGVQIGKFDIFKGNAAAEDINYAVLDEGFDQANLSGLDLMTEVLNAARARRGEAALTPADMDKRELQIRFEATERRVDFRQLVYFNITGQKSNERYTVERRHTRQVPCGTDSKGNTKYCTETYYTDETVVPSFENILSNSYDTGDRSVTGLGPIKERAATMVAREARPRQLAANVDAYLTDLYENYQLIVSGQVKKRSVEKVQSEIAAYQEALAKEITLQAQYEKAGQSSYRNDNIENFHSRNKGLLARLENARDAMVAVSEALRRGLHDVYPNYDLYDFTNWMLKLKSIRNWNYGKKGFMAAVVAMSIGWSVSHDFQDYVGYHTYDLNQQIHSIIDQMESTAHDYGIGGPE